MSDIKVNVTPNGGGVVTILQGDALPLQAPKKLSIVGDFNSVKNFIAMRDEGESELQAIYLHKSVITTNIVDGWIKLQTDPNDVFGTEVKAVIEMHPNLKAFGINSTKMYNQKEFVQLLKVNRRFFNSDFYDKLLNSYARFVIKSNTEATKQIANQVGSSNNGFNKNVDTGDLPLEFSLNIPIFKGGQNESFLVQVFVESVENSIKFFLESIDLIELIERRKEEVFAHQVEECFDGILVINE